MRRILLGLLAAVLIASGSTLVATPAQASTEPVTIGKISTRWIGWKGTAVVKPAVRKSAGVTVTKKRLTVRKGKRVLQRNRASVRLKPGTYRVTTRVTYRHESRTRTVTRTQRLVVRQGRCATKANYRSVKARVAPKSGDKVRTVSRKLHSSGTRLSDVFGVATLAEWRRFFKDDAEAREDLDELIDHYGADATFDVGFYDVCGSESKTVDVTFIGGHAVAKELGSGM